MTHQEAVILEQYRRQLASGVIIVGQQANYIQELIVKEWLEKKEMSGTTGGARKLICKNPDCINKSVVYRRFDFSEIPTCKGCGSVLSSDIRTKMQIKRSRFAKRELKRYSSL